ncbi:hypothetical protein ACFOLD_04645 [Kocuria carniphila]|uniref:hypothetical protein n=1 Tax=Kocuria carniphila TaxID=262208 RepID=UPI00361AAC4D
MFTGTSNPRTSAGDVHHRHVPRGSLPHMFPAHWAHAGRSGSGVHAHSCPPLF